MKNRKTIVDGEVIPSAEIKPNMDFEKVVTRYSGTTKYLTITKNIVVGLVVATVTTVMVITYNSSKQSETATVNSKVIAKTPGENTVVAKKEIEEKFVQKKGEKADVPVKNKTSVQKKSLASANNSSMGSKSGSRASSSAGNIDKVKYSSLKDYYKQNAVQSQKFVVDAGRDTIIVGKQGTEFAIRANSFVDVNNNPVSGSIDVELKECYSMKDMLAEQLTTTSKDKILESGGMVYLGARSGGKELKLKKFEEIEMHNPSAEVTADTSMYIYYGEKTKSGINWEKDDYSRIPYPTAVMTAGKFYDTISIDYYARNYRFEKKKMVDLLGRKDSLAFSVSFDELKKPIGFSGGQVGISGTGISEFLDLVKNNYVPSVQASSWLSSYEFEIFNKEDYQRYIRDYRAYVRNEDINKGSFVRSYDASSVFGSQKNAPFYIGKIGWLNCDRRMQPTIDVNEVHFTLNSEKEEDLKMVFLNEGKQSIINAVRMSNTWYFPNIPVDREVMVTGTLYKDGEVKMAYSKFKVMDKEKLHELDYSAPAL